MKEAQRHDPQLAPVLLTLLLKGGRDADIENCARGIVADQGSSPAALYLAAAALLRRARTIRSPETRQLLEQLIIVLHRALTAERATPRERREIPRLDAAAAAMLGLCLERLGRSREALEVYEDALSHYPADPELLTLRGIARYDSARQDALEDFRRAAAAGSTSIWPYYFCAHSRLVADDYHGCWQWCLQGLERHAPREVNAQLHEWLGICRVVLRQPAAVVLDSFDQAIAIDPGNKRIVANRDLAERVLFGARTASSWDKEPRTRPWVDGHTILPTIRVQQEFLAVQHDSRLDRILAGAAG